MFLIIVIVVFLICILVINYKKIKFEDESYSLVKKLYDNMSYINIKKQYSSNIKKVNIFIIVFNILTILMLIYTIIVFLKFSIMSIVTLGGIMYHEAGDPGGKMGSNMYNFYSHLIFYIAPIIIGILSFFSAIFSLYKTKYVYKLLNKELENKKD